MSAGPGWLVRRRAAISAVLWGALAATGLTVSGPAYPQSFGTAAEPPDGVVSTTSGYTGGHTERPSYAQVGASGTGHLEAVRVIFDPSKISYKRLLEVFWHNVDPLDAGGQFCDRGETYRTAIFVHDDGQRRLAEASKAALEAEDRRRGAFVTQIRDAGPFWPAEDYHQDYYRKNPARYRFYRWNCGRDARLREVWGAGAAGGH
jgi:peptide-methionine (S)-S-oxide reductase